MEGVFRKISQPYLTSVTDEDIPDMNVVNALASVISNELMEKHRVDEAKNSTNISASATQAVAEPEDSSTQKYIANCEKYDYIGSPTVEVVHILHRSILLLMCSEYVYVYIRDKIVLNVYRL